MKTSIFQPILRPAAIGLMAVLFAPISLTGLVQEREKALSTCALVQHAAQYEDQTVIVESTVVADLHAVVLEGPSCGLGVYLSYAAGRSGGKWKALDDAIAAKASGLDKRVLHVEVRGIYHNALPAYKRKIRQIEVTEVLDVWFAD